LIGVVMAVVKRDVAGGVPERIDAQRALIGDRTNEIEARVLVPTARLIEVGERHEQHHKQDGARSHDAVRIAPEMPATSIVMLTSSPTTVASAAPSAPMRGMT